MEFVLSQHLSQALQCHKVCFLSLIYLFLAALGLRCCTRAFSSCGERGLLFLLVLRLLFAVASLAVEHGLWARGLQELWLVGSRAQAQQLWRTGLVAPQHVGSSWTWAWTRVPCIGRWILNHCATGEAHDVISYWSWEFGESQKDSLLWTNSVPSKGLDSFSCLYHKVSTWII